MYPIGKICAQFRRECGYRLCDIAKDLKTTSANICHFEHDRNNSSEILMWYVLHGLTAKYILDRVGSENE